MGDECGLTGVHHAAVFSTALLWVLARFQYFENKSNRDILPIIAEGKSLHYGLKLSGFC